MPTPPPKPKSAPIRLSLGKTGAPVKKGRPARPPTLRNIIASQPHQFNYDTAAKVFCSRRKGSNLMFEEAWLQLTPANRPNPQNFLEWQFYWTTTLTQDEAQALITKYAVQPKAKATISPANSLPKVKIKP